MSTTSSKSGPRACFVCNETGHLRRNCPQRQTNNNATRNVASAATAKPRKQQQRNKVKTDVVVELPKNQPLVPLIDIGINLTNTRFRSDLDRVLDRSVDAGVNQLIITGTSEKASKQALRLCKTLNQQRKGTLKVHCTIGCHPHDAKSFTETTAKTFKKLLGDDDVVAVGECGLDFNRMFSPQEVQESVFKQQIELAIELKKPLFLHERDAHESFLKIMSDVKDRLTAPVVVHCFTGSLEQVQSYLDLGFYIGLTGFICDEREGRGKHLKEVAKHIPIDKLMIETDGPFICPRNLPRRLSNGGRCEPWHLTYVLSRLAECRDVAVPSDEFTAMCEQIYKNTELVFGLADE